MRPKTTLILATICIILLFHIAPKPVSAEGDTYLIQLKNGAEIICDKMIFQGDTLFYMFYSYEQNKVGINKNAIKAIFIRKEAQGKEPQGWGGKIFSPRSWIHPTARGINGFDKNKVIS